MTTPTLPKQADIRHYGNSDNLIAKTRPSELSYVNVTPTKKLFYRRTKLGLNMSPKSGLSKTKTPTKMASPLLDKRVISKSKASSSQASPAKTKLRKASVRDLIGRFEDEAKPKQTPISKFFYNKIEKGPTKSLPEG